MKKTFVLIGCLLLTIGGAFAQSQVPQKHEFSLQEALEFGQQNNVQVKNALLDILMQEQTNRGVAAGALPSISGSGSLLDNLKLQTTLLPGEFLGQPPGTFVPVTFGTKYITSASVDLNQVIFDGQVFIGLKARKTSMDWKKMQAEVTKETIRTNIYKVYYQLVVSRTQIELINANIALAEKLNHDTKIMYQNGVAEKLDVDKSVVQLANLQTEKEKVLVSVANGYNGLKVLLGMSVKDTLVLTDTLSEDQIRDNILVGEEFAYEQRNDYKSLELTKKLDLFNVKRYQYSKLPTLKLEASYSKQSQENEFRFTGDWYTSSYVGLRLNVPIFSGFGNNSKIKEAQFEVEKVDNQLFNLRQNIDNEITTARNNFKSAINIMDYQKKNMELAETVYDQTKKKYEIGSGSQTEINTAQTDLKTAQTNYINALYDAVIAKTDYLKATGKL